MSRRDLTDDELEAALRDRAAARGYRFEVERTAEGREWKAVFRADPLPGQESLAPEGIGAMSAENPDRRRALEQLLDLDEMERERGR